MFDGKLKALTFSYDDGVTQDRRLIEIFDFYRMKATFNLNSETLGRENPITGRNGVTVTHNKVQPGEVKELYKNHEIAVHTLTHPNLTNIEDDGEVIRQVEQDRLNLERLGGKPVTGMAYPCGGVNNNERVASLIKKNTGVKYSRTITSSNNFSLQTDLYRFNPSVHHTDFEDFERMAREFAGLKPEDPRIFYVWGHSYEFDFDNSWDRFANILELLAGKNDIFYGTNRDVLL